MFLILFLLNVLGCSGFVPHPIGLNYVAVLRNPDLVSSWAKASKKKSGKKPAAVSPGGFGKVADTAKEVDDFAAFPALETQVAETLVPSPPEWLEAGGLPAEVYDRLGQIYGFRNFNYETSEEGSAGGESISFDDLISSTGRGASSSSSDNSKSSLSDGDFGDLLASATGASVETPKVAEDSTMDSISSLPPFSDFRVVHVDPLVLAIDDFFTEEECDRYVTMSTAPANSKSKDAPFQTRSKTVGKDALAKSQRTSTTWFHHYKNVPELMAKASRLLGLDGIDRWEEPQTVRYRRSEKFTWHLDALAPDESEPQIGGQRTATLIVYLTDLSASNGGATMFRDLSGVEGMLKVQPKKGSGLLFFPAAGGIPNTPFDIRTLHCGEAVDESSSQDKWISQLWLRESKYTPSAPPGNQHSSAKSAIEEYSENK